MARPGSTPIPGLGDEFAALDDRVIRLRAAGTTYTDMAAELGWSSASEAQRRYRAARARQIPAEHRPRSHARPSGFTIAWAAGFFDGEGCVFGYEGIQRGYRRFMFGVTVSQVDLAPLEYLQRHWGGSLSSKASRQPGHRDQWRWGIRGRDAGHFLSDILPYLRVKQRVARAAAPLLLATHGHGIPYSTAEIERAREVIAVLHNENRRGPRGGG